MEKKMISHEGYFKKVNEAIKCINNSHKMLHDLWGSVPAGVEIDDYLSFQYPFQQSHDELVPDIMIWQQDCNRKLEQAIENQRSKVRVWAKLVNEGLAISNYSDEKVNEILSNTVAPVWCKKIFEYFKQEIVAALPDEPKKSE